MYLFKSLQEYPVKKVHELGSLSSGSFFLYSASWIFLTLTVSFSPVSHFEILLRRHEKSIVYHVLFRTLKIFLITNRLIYKLKSYNSFFWSNLNFYLDKRVYGPNVEIKKLSKNEKISILTRFFNQELAYKETMNLMQKTPHLRSWV